MRVWYVYVLVHAHMGIFRFSASTHRMYVCHFRWDGIYQNIKRKIFVFGVKMLCVPRGAAGMGVGLADWFECRVLQTRYLVLWWNPFSAGFLRWNEIMRWLACVTRASSSPSLSLYFSLSPHLVGTHQRGAHTNGNEKLLCVLWNGLSLIFNDFSLFIFARFSVVFRVISGGCGYDTHTTHATLSTTFHLLLPANTACLLAFVLRCQYEAAEQCIPSPFTNSVHGWCCYMVSAWMFALLLIFHTRAQYTFRCWICRI